MFVPCANEENDVNFEEYSLILPAVSIGNVGQLTIDLLIYNLDLKRVGYLYDSSILPLVGNDPFSSSGMQEGSLVTSAEVYKCDEKKLVAVQLRAPLAKGCRQLFCDHIVKWIKDCRIKQTILLTSCIASERLDSQIQSGPFRYLLSPETQHLNEVFQEKLNWRCLEERNGEERSKSDVFLPGGGVSKRFYQTCCREGVPLVTLLVFCAEGDNIPDAMVLLYFVNNWLQMKITKLDDSSESQKSKVEWRQPPSWENLYGTSSFSEIF